MGLFTIFASCLGLFRRKRTSHSEQLQARPLVPRTLERRRVLDASAAGAALAPLAELTDTVQTGLYDTGEGTENEEEIVLSGESENTSPSNLQIQPLDPVLENGFAQLSLSFDDPDFEDSHTVEIDWGDGTVETINLNEDQLSLVTQHQYLDDDPTATPSDLTPIMVTVTDSYGESVSESATVEVINVDPEITFFSVTSPINENDSVILQLAFEDVGSLDNHTVEIDWGDGTPIETIILSDDQFSLVTQHKYLDDNPSGTPSDDYTVTATVIDDDTGSDSAMTVVTVNNVNPILMLNPLADISENDSTTLSGNVSDVGTLDTFTLDIDWGDPLSPDNVQSFNLGNVVLTEAADGINWNPVTGDFSLSHQYLDDNPSGDPSNDYTVSVTVTDDDTGTNMAMAMLTVSNVAPMVTINDAPLNSPEGTQIDLTSTVVDPGSLDTFTYAWEASVGGNVVATGSDPNFSFTPADDGTYLVKLEVTDDDGESGMNMVSIEVMNVDPTLAPIANITANEGEFIMLPPATFSDPGFDLVAAGTQENFTATIDWGDGTTEPVGDITLVEVPGSEGVLTTGTIQAMHAYADNGVYTVTVTVIDDDGGSASQMFEVTVSNVNPTLDPIANITANEGEFIMLPPATFSDPGFDLAAAGTQENFTATIDWGDGTTEPVGDITLVEVPGSEGVLTTGTIQAMHAYADNGVYTVTVTVIDDDGGVGMAEFTVTVANVAPSLTGVDGSEILDEGEEFTLADFGLGISDPGFDNPLNVGGELEETFTGVSIDWGDGTAAIPVNVVNRVSGSEGVLTTAEFDHAAHAYADNGTYTVTVTFSDDDGGVTAAEFEVIVNNVAPTLVLTDRVLVINEGDTLDLFDLGTFSDPGFDNPANPNGASTESFTYEITWEQGVAPEGGLLPATEVDGMQGTPTTGTLADSHLYIDNDDDSFFTITVTLTDDDGGSDTQQIMVQVNNLNPVLDPIAATDINTKGETVLTLSFDDIGIETAYLTADDSAFRIMIDWGYVGVPGMEGFIEQVDYNGGTPESFVIQHTYMQQPNPMNPAADLILRVQILDDDNGNDLVMAEGASNIEIVAISNPGIGGQPVSIDTTPQVPRLTFQRTSATALSFQFSTTSEANVSGGDIRSASSDSKATTEQILELRVIDSYGVESEGIPLKAEVLNNLPDLFYKLPDNHYVIYLVRQETNSERLVIEIYLRGGRIIDPTDDSEGLRNRPPTEEQNDLLDQTGEQGQQDSDVDAMLEEVKETLQDEIEPEGELRIEPAQPIAPPSEQEVGPGIDEGASRDRSTTQMLGLATGLVATRSFGTWARRVDRTLAQADKKKWRELRRRTRHKRKNR